jgi:site-specific DNA-methyltransferase (adenine-specific)
MNNVQLFHGDCLEIMKNIPDKSIDMILCDLPYGVTKCKWDEVIPFKDLWKQYNRIIKDNGAIVLFGTEPFSSYLRISNINQYRYDIIWEKERVTNFFFVKKQIAKCHEVISVFYKKQPTYNPQMQYIEGKKAWKRKGGTLMKNSLYEGQDMVEKDREGSELRYPRSVQKFSMHNNRLLHPTQKPVDLLEFLINTYTNKNDVVLDNAMGSGSTGIACINTKRNFIGIELDKNYFDIAEKRIKDHKIRSDQNEEQSDTIN